MCFFKLIKLGFVMKYEILIAGIFMISANASYGSVAPEAKAEMLYAIERRGDALFSQDLTVAEFRKLSTESRVTAILMRLDNFKRNLGYETLANGQAKPESMLRARREIADFLDTYYNFSHKEVPASYGALSKSIYRAADNTTVDTAFMNHIRNVIKNYESGIIKIN